MIDKDKNNTVGIICGRYQPWHVGHEQNLLNLFSMGCNKIYIFVSDKKDKYENPLSFTTRKKTIVASTSKRLIKSINIVNMESVYIKGYVPSMIDYVLIAEEKVDNIIISCGEDRHKDYVRQLKSEKKRFKMIDVIIKKCIFVESLYESIQRNRVSATKIRDLIKNKHPHWDYNMTSNFKYCIKHYKLKKKIEEEVLRNALE